MIRYCKMIIVDMLLKSVFEALSISSHADFLVILYFIYIQGVPQLSIHFVSVILLASTHPNFKSWDSFGKFRKFAT